MNRGKLIHIQVIYQIAKYLDKVSECAARAFLPAIWLLSATASWAKNAHDGVEVPNQNANEWCYTQQPEYAFHSGLSTPPELCVLPTKRYLTTDMNPERILRVAETYRPGILLLGRNNELTNAVWKKWVDQGYILNAQNDTLELWIDKQLNPESLEDHHTKLNIMGL